jgi:hypothetical protein
LEQSRAITREANQHVSTVFGCDKRGGDGAERVISRDKVLNREGWAVAPNHHHRALRQILTKYALHAHAQVTVTLWASLQIVAPNDFIIKRVGWRIGRGKYSERAKLRRRRNGGCHRVASKSRVEPGCALCTQRRDKARFGAPGYRGLRHHDNRHAFVP